jgi:uncharacterized linocin/CFP29 family protein
MDVIFNGQAQGSVASVLLQNNFDVHSMRPFVENGRQYVNHVANGKVTAVPLVGNATATLRKDEWKLLDDAVVKAAKPRLKAVGDLRGSGLTYTIPNGMAKTILETETQGDINDATISMDALREGANDRPLYELTSLPLPIIHKDFSFSARQIATSRNGGSPLDTTMAELAARKVAETAEKLLIGSYGTYAFGGGTIYGYINYPNSIAGTVTNPTSSGWLATTLLDEVLAMRQSSIDAYHYGPWKLYMGTSWLRYLDNDYSTSYPGVTVRQRLAAVDGIQSINTLDYLTGYKVLLVQQTSDVIREVIGMDLTTVQWETHGGLLQHFKVMAIMVPQLRCDQNGNTGLVYATGA